MIVVRVELHSAITGQITEIGRMEVCNTGSTASTRVADYEGRVMRKPLFKSITRRGHVSGHRRQDETIWHLVGKMLKTMGYVPGE